MGLSLSIGVSPTKWWGAAQSFNPLDLVPALWLDASDTSTITESSGAVSEWRDRSGNARHFSQGTAANQPTTGSVTLNGRNTLQFTGDDWMSVSGHNFDAAAAGITLFGVVRTDVFPLSGNLIIMAQGDGPSVGRQFLEVNASGYATRIANGVQATVTPTLPGTWVVMRVTMAAGIGQTATLTRNNSVSATATSTMGSSTGTLYLGSTKTITNLFTGVIAELVIFGRVLNASEILSMQNYLNGKWVVY